MIIGEHSNETAAVDKKDNSLVSKKKKYALNAKTFIDRAFLRKSFLMAEIFLKRKF